MSEDCPITLGEISSIRTGKLDANAQTTGGVYPFFTCGEEVLWIDTPAFDTEAVLLAGNGNFGVKYFKGKFNAYQRTYVIEPQGVDGKWLFYLVKRHIARITSSSRGSTIPYLRLGDIADCEVNLPPLAEQKRIVAKIEELFSELDAGEESLRRARRQLGVYRQSLLKQAFEGKLTAPWRAQHPDLLESPEELLTRIQDEREARYEKQLAEWDQEVNLWEKGDKTDKKPSKPKKTTSQPIDPDESDLLPALPKMWAWSSFSTIADIDSNLRSPEDFLEHPHIAPDNIAKKTGRLLSFRTIREDEVISPKHLFYKDQIIYSKIRPYLSKLIIAQFEGLCSADMYPVSTYLETRFLYHFMLSKRFVKRASTAGSRTVLPKINQKELSSIPVPLCTLPEQQEIVRLLDEQFEVIEQNEREIDTALKRSETLRQSILKKAFSGKLVPQDPADEPASVLLDRIRAEREAQPATKKPKKKAARKRAKSS